MEIKMTAEIQFAQHLASNNPKVRDKAVKKLAKWFKTRACGKPFDSEELKKIWKGLFYCMWMSDKPLVQEKLADKLSEMIHCFGQSTSAYVFIETFFQTMAREWYGLDRYRIEKFMMLIRRFLRQVFHFLKLRQWQPKPMKTLLQILTKSVLSPDDNEVPAGLKIHVADVYLEEVARVGGTDFKTKKLLKFLDPYCTFLAESKDAMLLKAISKSIFLDLIENEEPLFTFKVKFSLVADLLLRHASDEGVNKDNRDKMYKLVGSFRDASKGVLPSDRMNLDVDLGRAIDKKEIYAAARRYIDDGDQIQDDRENWKKTKRKCAVEDFSSQLSKKVKGEDFLPETNHQFKKVKDVKSTKISKLKTTTQKGKYVVNEKEEIAFVDNDTTNAGRMIDKTRKKSLKKTVSTSKNSSSTINEHSEAGNRLKRKSSNDKFQQQAPSDDDYSLQRAPTFESMFSNKISNIEKNSVKNSTSLKVSETTKRHLPIFTITPQPKNFGGFMVTPQPQKKQFPERNVETDLSLQKPSIESTNSVLRWDSKASAKAVYSVLAKERNETPELETKEKGVFKKRASFSDDVIKNPNANFDDPVINIERKTSNTATDYSDFSTRGSGSGKKNVSFASFEKFVATPPCFFRKSASKVGARRFSLPISGILKNPF